jgi:oligoribonuclease NrnB/cAMP/cGMP phosphodiesterase (DHH superfamily)
MEKTNEIVYVFTHTDADGRCSGAIVNKYYTELGKIVKLKEIDYGIDYGLEKVPDGSLVVITDFSLEPAQMKELWARDCTTIWIDHHESAINKYTEAGIISDKRLIGLWLNEKKSGAYLAWQYFYPSEKIPLVVEMVSKFDVWVMEDKETTDKFAAGLYTINDDPVNGDWLHLFNDDSLVEDIIHKGGYIVMFRSKFAEEYDKFEVEFEGYRCLACNLSGMGSFAFGSRLDELDFVISFCFDGNEWKYGLYQGNNKTVNLGQLASKYGGGGHKGAAGFKTKEFLFNKV